MQYMFLVLCFLVGCSDSVERASNPPPPPPPPIVIIDPDNVINVTIPTPETKEQVMLFNDIKPDTNDNLSQAFNDSVIVSHPTAINYDYCLPGETHYKRVFYDNHTLISCLSVYQRKFSSISDFLPKEPMLLSASLFFEVYHELIHSLINNHPNKDSFYNVYGEQDIYTISIVGYLNLPNMNYINLSGDTITPINIRGMEILYAMFYSATVLSRHYAEDAYENLHQLDANYTFVICSVLAFDLILDSDFGQWFDKLSFDPTLCAISVDTIMTTYNDINRIFNLFKKDE